MAIKINFSEVGEADRRNLSSTFLKAAERFYEDPENKKRFEKWKAERDARK